jgi:hypothetical protein
LGVVTGVSELGGYRLAGLVEDVGQEDARAFLGEQPCVRLTLSTRRTRHDGDFVLNPTHCSSRPHGGETPFAVVARLSSHSDGFCVRNGQFARDCAVVDAAHPAL